MAKKNRDYWRKRFDQVEQAANNQSVEYIHSLEEKYRIAERELNGKINAWYQRFADNNEMTITEAKKFLNNSELKEFKWTVEEYIKHGEENALTQAWIKELENASARFHINRFEALKVEIRQQIEVATGGLMDDVDNLVKSVYSDSFYRSCFEVQKGVGIGFDVSGLDANKISKLLSKPWSVDGTNFSEKLWKNKAQLINTLDQELSRMVLTGALPDKAIANIKKAMNTSKFAAGRLVMAEQAYFTSLAQKDAFSELDIEEYEYVGTLDNITCDECGNLDGQHFPLKDMQPGINAPPMHPFCRCIICPYFDDEFTNGKRASRDASGKTVYQVPENMTYREWEETFVNGGDKTGLQEVVSDDTMKAEEPEQKHTVVDRPIIEQDEIIEQAKIYGDDLLQHPDLIQYDNGEPISNYVNSQIGYDALPRVVSADEFTQLSQGKQILYRGVTDYKDISATEMVEQFKTGRFYCGRGVYGNGTYTDYDKKVARYYAYESGITSNGQIMEMLLSDDAKTISFLDIYMEYEKTGIPKLTADKREAFQDVIGDIGVYAAIKGYDAILLNGFQNKNHVVILNRSKIIVKE